MRAVDVVIRGRVQGVGFRWNAKNAAFDLGLRGYVRNASDGSVEAVFVGGAAAIEQMISWCRKGPSAARVSGVDVRDIEPESYDSFTIE